MSQTEQTMTTAAQSTRMERYYRFHSQIYDATRWSFLFGRQAILQYVTNQPRRILEVGCGTGKNLLDLARHFPQADIVGLDISDSMLQVARRKISPFKERVWLLQRSYDRPFNSDETFDLVLFSYSLTMMNPGWSEAIDSAYQDLAEGGMIAVVDFHDSAWPAYKRWMGVNHVRMDGHLLPYLSHRFQPQTSRVCAAYGGVWQYLMFAGIKEREKNGQTR